MQNNFKKSFLAASSADRAQLLIATAAKNARNPQIGNLLQNVNVNDINIKNKMRADNIHFICAQLQLFPDFTF
jgi:hypothetical protein